MTAALRAAGLTSLTTIDFPGRLAAVVFLQGCPWRCGYCHNPGLISPTAPAAMSWNQVHAFLVRRRGLLDAVVFSGGEPTLQEGLADAMGDARRLGFLVGLHTAGMYPQRLARLLPLVDWVGLDIKAPVPEHAELTGAPRGAAQALESLAHVLQSGVAYECRTTWQPGLYPLERLQALGDDLAQRGVRNWTVQLCRSGGQSSAPPSPPGLHRAGERFSAFQVR